MRFGETDSAGVIYFSEVLRWCHEAWEESLEKYGISASSVFPKNGFCDDVPEIALPIIHCEADYLEPIYVGDFLDITLSPKRIDLSSFLLQVKFYRGEVKVAFGLLKHIAINARTRKRSALTKQIDLWLEASSLSLGVNSI